MAVRNSLESDSLTLYEKRSELKRVIESKYFAKAPKRRRFLEFTSGQVFVGEEGKLNEYLIGVEVYERGTDFDPQQDPIVRVQAHEIRRLLKSYYEEEGKDSLVRVELHPGQYAPIFRRVKVEAESPAVSPVQGESAADNFTPLKSQWQNAVMVLLGLVCIGLGFSFVRERDFARQSVESRTLTATLPESEEWFWRPFLTAGSQPLIVVPTPPVLRLGTDGDSPQTLQGGYSIPKNKVPQFRDTFHFSELKNFTFVPTTTDFTGIGDALGLVDIARFLTSQGMVVRAKTSRLTDYKEIQGGNTIILGGGNAWSNRVFAKPPGFYVGAGVFKNNASGPTDASEYAPRFDPVTNRLTLDYALILMEPNHTKQDRLLLLYGLYTQGTEGAAEYVTNAERLAELRKALVALAPDKKTPPSYFEALISVPVENYVPGAASLVAAKITP
ncbi:hypothetical protein SBA2_230012 [Acidobacteriia bacterium SbA2]|nr:hypothetical protein SBA2_230012 [Acidobacteriia bacterium SbA2]